MRDRTLETGQRFSDGFLDRYRQALVVGTGLARAVGRDHDDDFAAHRPRSVVLIALSSLLTISSMWPTSMMNGGASKT